ncbi:MAG TPA: hypothetical protein VN698_12805, partial [Bacteroidia bacterium]|nr:hypothetical protein [Bacteroidia bacterium]
RKEVFGLTRKELLIAAFFVASSLTLIIYSSLKLIHNHYTNNNITQAEIQNQSKCLAYLNDLNTFTLNTQRGSVNVLVYRSNTKEVKNFKKNIENNRDSLLLKLNRIDNSNFTLQDKKTELLYAGLNYLNVNSIFLQMLNDSASTEHLSDYNLAKMRPAVRQFVDLIRKNSKIVVEKIQYVNNDRASIFKQVEFWLLLIGLGPYIYFFYRIIALIVRMILWEIFS